jgi:hypothetical protein
MRYGWIGVDLDGTLSSDDGCLPPAFEIGPPIPKMLERVKAWLEEGKDVRIFTARANFVPGAEDSDYVDHQIQMIEAWCEKHIGVVLPVTSKKDYYMVEYWDDRAVQVVRNLGCRVDGKE